MAFSVEVYEMVRSEHSSHYDVDLRIAKDVLCGCELKFIFRIGEKHYGFEGEITDEKLAEYDCVETTFLPSIQQ